MTNKEYQEYIKSKIPKPDYLKNAIRAFVVGGSICLIGQIVRNILFRFGLDEKAVATGPSMIMVFLGSVLTGIGIYDKIG